MTCVYEEYKFKIKVVQEQSLQLKMKALLGYNMELLFSGENKYLGLLSDI